MLQHGRGKAHFPALQRIMHGLGDLKEGLVPLNEAGLAFRYTPGKPLRSDVIQMQGFCYISRELQLFKMVRYDKDS